MGKLYEVSGSVPDNLWIDTDAPADHDYRYAAIVIGARQAKGTIAAQQVGSDPSPAKRISDVSTTLRASAWNFLAGTTPPPTVELRVEKFVPDRYTSVGGQPPDDPDYFTNPINPFVDGQSFSEEPGSLPRGIDLHVSGTMQSSEPFYYSFLGVYPTTPSSSLPGGTMTYPGGGTLLTINDSVMKVYDATASGDETKGFDSRSNPLWQMLTQDSQRTLTFKTDMAVNPVKDDPLTIAPESLPVGTSSLTVSANGSGPGEKEVSLPGLRAKVKIDVRPKRNPTVAVYPVYRVKIDAQHPDGVRIGAITLPKKEGLEAELNAIYRDQANVFFTVVIAPEVLEFTPLNDKDGNGRCAINDTKENVKLSDKANNNGFDYTLFLFAKGVWEQTFVLRAGTPQEDVRHLPGQGGQALLIPGKWAVSDSPDVTLLAHELGHCMGLNHAFANGNTVTGNSNIPDASDTRVMGYGSPLGRRLIKPERDIIFQNLPPY